MTERNGSGALRDTSPAELDRILRRAQEAQRLWADLMPDARAHCLEAVAAGLDREADVLIAIAEGETGLSSARLRGEVARTCGQLRMFADEVRAGRYLDARVDQADEAYSFGPRPDLRRVLVPIGTVLNFAASNFPFAFSVAGGDTAAALAAGCSVVLKAHPGHPELAQSTARIVVEELGRSGAPEGLFSLVTGDQAGVSALKDERVDAAAFTGSTQVGRMLADIAAGRPRPIPFFGELGSVNPVFVTSAALLDSPAEIAAGYVNSVSGSAGQLCTKPGVIWVPDGGGADDFESAVAAAASEVSEHRLLNPRIGARYVERRGEILAASGVRTVAAGTVRIDAEEQVFATPTFVSATAATVEAQADLLEEVFGPFSIIVRYKDGLDLAGIVSRYHPGNLTGTIQHRGDDAVAEIRDLIAALERTCGRILMGGWPTGVTVTHAQQHGGPYPATTNDTSTSVGTASITRFLRGVAYQAMPQSFLPMALRDENPLKVPQAEA